MGYEVLYNFISPVTGRILCDPGKVLVGDPNGIAIPSSAVPPSALFLPFNNLFIGNESNQAIPTPNIQLNNMAPLGLGNTWVGDTLGRPVEVSISSLVPAVVNTPNNLAKDTAGDAVSSLVSYALQKLFGDVVGFGTTLLGGTLGTVGVGGVFEIFKGIGSGLNKLGDGALGNVDSLETEIDRRLRINARRNSQVLPVGAGAPSASDKNIVYYFVDMSLGGGRLENIAPSPLADYDAVNAKWVWDLLHDNVEIVFGEQLN